MVFAVDNCLALGITIPSYSTGFHTLPLTINARFNPLG